MQQFERPRAFGRSARARIAFFVNDDARFCASRATCYSRRSHRRRRRRHRRCSCAIAVAPNRRRTHKLNCSARSRCSFCKARERKLGGLWAQVSERKSMSAFTSRARARRLLAATAKMRAPASAISERAMFVMKRFFVLFSTRPAIAVVCNSDGS